MPNTFGSMQRLIASLPPNLQGHMMQMVAPASTGMQGVISSRPPEQGPHKKKTGLKKFLHKPLKEGGKFVQRKVMPIAAPLVGAVLGGPAGAVAGGAISGSLQGRHDIGKNMLKGAGIGLAVGATMGLGNVLTGGTFMGGGIPGMHGAAAGSGGLSGALGGGASGQMGPGLMFANSAGAAAPATAQMGPGIMLANAARGAAPATGGLLGGLGGSAATGAATAGGAGLLSRLFGAGSGIGGSNLTGSHLIDAGLLGTAALGGMRSESRPDRREQQEYDAFRRGVRQGQTAMSPHMPMPTGPHYQRRVNPFYTLENMRAGVPGAEVAFTDDTINFADGGYVHGGYIPGNSSGVADDYRTSIPEGSFVIDATTLAALGDGNPQRANKQFDEIESDVVPYAQWNPRKRVEVKLSPGERVVTPEAVKKIGRGSAEKGAQKIEKARTQVRKDKGMKKGVPPKAKPLKQYLR